jgi:hypothetical protein
MLARPSLDSQEDAPNLEQLLEGIRARVEERRTSGAYPPGLEEALANHFRHIAEHRPIRNLEALRTAMETFEKSLVFDANLISTTSRLPGGEALHRTVAKLVSRQTAGIVQQMRDFAEAVRTILWAMVATMYEPTHIHADLIAQIDAVLDRLAYYEQASAVAAPGDGSRDEVLEAYRRLAKGFAGCSPVVDLGDGGGELLDLLAAEGIEAVGVGLDDAITWLEAAPPDSIGGIAALSMVEALTQQELTEVIGLAAEKLGPGGKMVVTAGEVHPAYLAFLFREAGYSDVTVEQLTGARPGTRSIVTAIR